MPDIHDKSMVTAISVTLDVAALAGRPRHERVRIMSEAMRQIDPDGYNAAERSVRKNVQSAMQYQPHIFLPKS